MTGLINHIIQLENLSIGHQKDQALLKQINLSVRPGEMVALIGRNGSGKSTLLKSMLGLIPLIEGVCYLDGAPLPSYDFRLRAQKVSFVSSNVSQLPSISVGELVSLGRMPYTGFLGRMSPEDHEQVHRALEEVGMGSFARRKMEHLSDGERQRTMIARALAQDTPLMVLDEPTAFLDIPNKFELINLLSSFRNLGKSLVYSTHDLDTAMQFADKIWVIYQDRILEGAPEDMGLRGLFDTLFESSGISYDHQTRRFTHERASKGTLDLEGEEGKELLWTRIALERLGYRIERSAQSRLKVERRGDLASWTHFESGISHEFENLYLLARFLRKPD